MSAAAVTGATRRDKNDGSSRPVGGQQRAMIKATGRDGVTSSVGRSPAQSKKDRHRLTAVLIFAADEAGTAALTASATLRSGRRRTVLAPVGKEKGVTVSRCVTSVRWPCAVVTAIDRGSTLAEVGDRWAVPMRFGRGSRSRLRDSGRSRRVGPVGVLPYCVAVVHEAADMSPRLNGPADVLFGRPGEER
jgi:hypothetical protein